MLEAIRDRAQGWIAKVILALLIIPFALWGVDSYFSGTGKEAPAAKIDDHEITQREFTKALQEQRESLGGAVDDAALRQRVMDQLINTRLLAVRAREAGFSILDPQIHAVLLGIEIFQENGQFSETRMENWLRSRGMGRGELLAMIGDDLLLQQVQIGLGEGALVPRAVAKRMAALLSQRREVNERVFDGKEFAAAVRIDDAEIERHYAAHQNDYATPAQVRLEYVTLGQKDLEAGITVTDEQARTHYESNIARYQEPEMRRAAHILIQVDAGADAAKRQAAKARAEELLREARANPAKFAELARQHSQDPGSAANGGDLGFFTRDMMVKPFSDMVWSLKPDEFGEVVETQFGYHVIRLLAVTPGARMAFDAVKGDIVRELTEAEAQRRYIEAAERFSNLVYEQADSLQPAAAEFGLPLRQSGWIARDQRDVTPAFLAHPRLMSAVFSDEAVAQRQNTEAIEVAPNMLVAARVLEHRPPGIRPLADVAAQIRARLTAEAARKLAIEAGTKALAQANAGEVPAGLSAPMPVSRMQPSGLPAAALRKIFQVDSTRLPAYVGVESDEGYRLYRVNRVEEGVVPPGLDETLRKDLRRLTINEEMRAYIAQLKAGAKIKITPGTLDGKAD